MDEAKFAALMADAQGGNAEAYRSVLRACVPLIAASVRRVGVRPDAIDDVVQEVLLTMHRALATYDPARPFLPWLRAIATRRAIDALRAHGRRSGRETHDPEAYLNHAEPGASADDAAAALAKARQLRAAIATLPPRQRQAVELLGLEEQSLEEASRDTGHSKVALKVNLHRAIKTLRALMGGRSDV